MQIKHATWDIFYMKQGHTSPPLKSAEKEKQGVRKIHKKKGEV